MLFQETINRLIEPKILELSIKRRERNFVGCEENAAFVSFFNGQLGFGIVN